MEIAGSCRSSKFEVRNPKFETIRTANHEYSKKFECSPDKDLAAASSVITSGRSLKAPPAGPSSTYGKGGTGGNLSRKNWTGNVVGGI